MNVQFCCNPRNMNNVLQLIAFFFAQLALGSAIILPFFPARVIGRSWLQFYYGFIVLLLAIFLGCMYRLEMLSNNHLILFGFSVWIFLVSFRKDFARYETVMHWVYAFCSLVFLMLTAQKQFFYHNAPANYSLMLLFILAGTIFLAFHLMNMIFGHWYLINRELPIKHLVTACRNLIFVTYVRLISVGAATYLVYTKMSTSEFARLTDFMGHGVFFWARILAGLGIPWLVSHLAYSSAKIGSNQSATGILYAGTVFVLMGEIMTLYLFSITGIFF